jgi:hypothetical protein
MSPCWNCGYFLYASALVAGASWKRAEQHGTDAYLWSLITFMPASGRVRYCYEQGTNEDDIWRGIGLPGSASLVVRVRRCRSACLLTPMTTWGDRAKTSGCILAERLNEGQSRAAHVTA